MVNAYLNAETINIMIEHLENVSVKINFIISMGDAKLADKTNILAIEKSNVYPIAHTTATTMSLIKNVIVIKDTI